VTLIAIFVSDTGRKLINAMKATRTSECLQWLTVGSTFLILLQLILGATMRHQHAGLAVPDFPLAYARLWPPMDAAFLQKINSKRLGMEHFNSITSFHIGLHMTHRLVALSIVFLVASVAWKSWREHGAGSYLAKLSLAWLVIICLQATFGAATVWSNKAADIATAHVLLGALGLLTGTILSWTVLGQRRRSSARARRGGAVVWRDRTCGDLDALTTKLLNSEASKSRTSGLVKLGNEYP